MPPHFEHERRLEVRKAFEDIEKEIREVENSVRNVDFEVKKTASNCNEEHKDRKEAQEKIEKEIERIKLNIHGDGNGNEGLIRKMDKLKEVPNLIRSNTNTMRWSIGIFVSVNLGLIATLFRVATHS